MTNPQAPSTPWPFFAALQARQVPVQAVAQQTPSAQKVDRQSPFLVQAAPFAAAPVQAPATHVLPATQSVPRVHEVLHAVPDAQMYGAQLVGVGLLHAPRPSQRVSMRTPELHDVPHTVVLEYREHAPLPSHEPVVPQLVAPASAHSLSGSAPVAIMPHTPSVPPPFLAVVQATHLPPHAVSQHTPSVQ
jgi:hypothetical protein